MAQSWERIGCHCPKRHSNHPQRCCTLFRVKENHEKTEPSSYRYCCCSFCLSGWRTRDSQLEERFRRSLEERFWPMLA